MHKLFGIPKLALEPDILGAIFVRDRRIVVDESLDPDEYPRKEGRYRFTLAHETGHCRLHRHLFLRAPFRDLSGPSIVCRPSQYKKREERQADHFASCLLMPRRSVLELWLDRFGSLDPFIFELHKSNPAFAPHRSSWIHIGTAAAKVLGAEDEPDFKISFNRVAREFATVFNVSIEAMRIRLEVLGLLLRDLPIQDRSQTGAGARFEELVAC